MSLTLDPSPAVPQSLDPAARKLRWMELALILVISFGTRIVHSIYLVATNPYASSLPASDGAMRFAALLIDEGGQLSLLAYILFRQGRRFRDIGLDFRWSDLLRAVALYWISAWAYWGFHTAGWFALRGLGYALPSHPINLAYQTQAIHQGFLGFAISIVVGIVNPFAEELIVRAYTISEITALTGKPALAVLISVSIQTVYHFYQGILPPIGYFGLFLVFALYYARSKRIFPVILAHMADDLGSILHRL
jgi:membrane protease YdiL (CAAX protease family)